MLEQAIVLSLQITAIHVAFQQGNVLGWLRWALATALDKLHRPVLKIYIMKPITDCLTCSASVWGSILMLIELRGWSLWMLLTIAGVNYIIDNLFLNEPDPSDEPDIES